MKTIKLWAVLENTDKTEGRGPMRPVCYTETKEEALKVVNHPEFYSKYGVMGVAPYDKGEYNVSEETIIIVENAKEILDLEKEKEKERILSKLTPTEREILGLK